MGVNNVTQAKSCYKIVNVEETIVLCAKSGLKPPEPDGGNRRVI